jgi:hypothetical protein
VNWPDYVLLAEVLAAERLEASKRSAVSRAYYGTLNTCRVWLEANGAAINRHRVHAEVWGTFKATGCASTLSDGEPIVIAELGNKLRMLRNQADYQDSFPGLDDHAIGAVSAAKEVLAALATLERAD